MDPGAWTDVGETKAMGASRIHAHYTVRRSYFRNVRGQTLVLVMRVGFDLVKPEQSTTWLSLRPPLQDEKFESAAAACDRPRNLRVDEL